MIRVELSADTLSGALAADAAGADRIELCTAALDGGLTPSRGVIERAVALCAAPVHVLVRPRGGDFVYTAAELDAMVTDVATAAGSGAAGVVSGVLTPDGHIDTVATARLVAAAGGVAFTFHRAIDVCADPLAALDSLAELGVGRVLTSGGAPSAQDGRAMLAALVERAGSRLSVMACGGIRPGNVVAVVRGTGVTDVHAAPRRPQPGSPSLSGVDFRSGGPPAGFDRFELDEQVAARLCEIAHACRG